MGERLISRGIDALQQLQEIVAAGNDQSPTATPHAHRVNRTLESLNMLLCLLTASPAPVVYERLFGLFNSNDITLWFDAEMPVDERRTFRVGTEGIDVRSANVDYDSSGVWHLYDRFGDGIAISKDPHAL